MVMPKVQEFRKMKMIKDFLDRVYRFLVNSSIKEKVETPQIVSIEEYNKVKKATEEVQAKADSLSKINERKIEENKSIITNIEKLQSEIRIEKIANILSALTFKTDEERSKLLQTLVNSDLSIDFIRETYEPFKKNNINKGETKLPQKSVPDNRNDSSFIR